MAEQQFCMQAVSWGRTPEGRFVLQVNMQVSGPGGEMARVPVTTFILTKAEEDLLSACLRGLYVASPLTNGHQLT